MLDEKSRKQAISKLWKTTDELIAITDGIDGQTIFET